MLISYIKCKVWQRQQLLHILNLATLLLSSSLLSLHSVHLVDDFCLAFNMKLLNAFVLIGCILLVLCSVAHVVQADEPAAAGEPPAAAAANATTGGAVVSENTTTTVTPASDAIAYASPLAWASAAALASVFSVLLL